METLEEIIEYAKEMDYNDAEFFTNPSYATAFIGMTSDGRPVYDYDKMVDYLIKNHCMSFEEAREYIDFNVIDCYIPGMTPIVIYPI